jgi:hypothetical protein
MVRIFNTNLECVCLQKDGAAVVQVAGYHMYQFEMVLTEIDFNFLYGKDNAWVVKEMTVADCQTNRVSSSLYKIPYPWTEPFTELYLT